MKKRIYYAPDGTPDGASGQPDGASGQPDGASGTPEIHTAREVELENQIAALTSQVAELVEQNKKLYLKLSGTNGSDSEPSIEDKLKTTLNEWAQSGFNPELLYK